MKFLNHLDINENQTKKQKLYLSTAASYTPTGGEGNLIYDTSDDLLKYWDGSAWITLMNSSGGATYSLNLTDDSNISGANVANHVRLQLNASNGVHDFIAFAGVNNQTWVDEIGGNETVTIGLDDDVIINGTLTVGDGTLTGNTIIKGNLTVDGTTTTVNSNTVSVGDNIIVLNSDVTAAPTQDAGIEIERGTSANVQIRYNETNDAWEFTNDGASYCNIPCSTTGSVLSYYYHYADCDSGAIIPANSADSIKFVGGTCITTCIEHSGTTGSGMDEVIFNHSDITHASINNVGLAGHATMLDYGSHNCETATVLAHGDCFDVVEKVYFDGCGHRTHRTHKTYRLPDASASHPDQNLFEKFAAQNVIAVGGGYFSASGGIQTADSTQDTMWFQGQDTSVEFNTKADDYLTLKAAVKCTRAVIERSQLLANAPAGDNPRDPIATINHMFGTNDIIVELWEYSKGAGDNPNVAGCKVEADVCQEAFNGTSSNNHITVKFSEVPTTDILVIIHVNNNTIATTPQYS